MLFRSLARSADAKVKRPFRFVVSALRALGATDGIASIEPLFAHLLGRRPDASELDPVRAYVSGTGREDRALALMLASPAFQRH